MRWWRKQHPGRAYENEKAWRARNPHKRREINARTNDRYYNERLDPWEAPHRGQPWELADDLLVLDRDGLTDHEIAEKLGRSVRAVQHRRHRLRRRAHLV